MRILYVHPGQFPPEFFAGSGLAMDWLCRRLAAEGHDVFVAANSDRLPEKIVYTEPYEGYVVVRAKTLADALVRAWRIGQPDVVVGSHVGPWLTILLPAIGDVPFVVYEHEVSEGWRTIVDLKSRMAFVGNSETTARHLEANLGVACAVAPPLFGVDQYAGLKATGDKVLFVSLQPRKGADVAIRIAEARPDVEFIFVESWTRRPEDTEAMRGVVRQMRNVTLLANRPSLGDIYPQIKLLLMPSRGRESWGRTATEAQMCGIPVLGSDRGNLRATIGPGGATLDPDAPIEDWLAAFDAIMGDPVRHRDLSEKALAHATAFRPEIEKSYRTFERVLVETVEKRRASA